MRDEPTEDYRDMIYAEGAVEIEKRHKVFSMQMAPEVPRGRPLSGDRRAMPCRALDSLAEAGDWLFFFTRRDPSQRKSARATNAVERLNDEVRCIQTRTVPPCAETVPVLLRALMAPGPINVRKAVSA